MAKQYIGVAPLTMVRTKAGGYSMVYADQPVPADITDEDLKRLVDEGFLGQVEAAAAAQAEPATKPTTVEDILAEVGDDKEKAAAALEEELASSRPRKTLLEPLEAILSGS
jgi:sulfur carrier protein ThiS